MPRQSDQCARCGRTFASGDLVSARLFRPTPNAETPARAADDSPSKSTVQEHALPAKPAAEIDFVRRDYCPGCETDADQVPLATWRARRPTPADKNRRRIDPAAAFELFERLGSAASDEEVQLRFLLALLLWRKRVLKLTTAAGRRQGAGGNSDPRGGETWEFYHARTEQTFRVSRPALDDSQLEHLGDRLEEALAGSVAPESYAASVESESGGS